MGNRLAFRARTRSFFYPGSRAARSSDQVAAGSVGMGRFSTSGRGTKHFQPTVSPKSRLLSGTRSGGQRPRVRAGLTASQMSGYRRRGSGRISQKLACRQREPSASCRALVRSTPKQPTQQRQYDTDQDAGHNGEIERKVTLLDGDIAGKSSNPTE